MSVIWSVDNIRKLPGTFLISLAVTATRLSLEEEEEEEEESLNL